MVKTELTAKRALELLSYDPETGLILRVAALTKTVKVGDRAGTVHPIKKYRYLYVDGKRYFEHRIAWLMHYGEWPTQQIDHINGDRADNRISNLRNVDQVSNLQNRRFPTKGNTSGLLGVSWMTGANKWRAQIKTKEKVIYLGIFESKDDAHNAYLIAKTAMHSGSTI